MTYNVFSGTVNPTQSIKAVNFEVILDFNEARDDGVTVASAGPHAPDR